MKILFAISTCFIFNYTFAFTNEEATANVNNLLKNTQVSSARHYCTKGSMTCRSLFTFKNTTTNETVPMFRISFYSPERQVAASEYYVQDGKTSKYFRFVDSSFDGAVNITKADEVQTVLISNNEYTIKDLYMPKLGTTQYVISDLVFNDSMAFLNGTQKDTANAEVNSPIHVEYLRINP